MGPLDELTESRRLKVLYTLPRKLWSVISAEKNRRDADTEYILSLLSPKCMIKDISTSLTPPTLEQVLARCESPDLDLNTTEAGLLVGMMMSRYPDDFTLEDVKGLALILEASRDVDYHSGVHYRKTFLMAPFLYLPMWILRDVVKLYQSGYLVAYDALKGTTLLNDNVVFIPRSSGSAFLKAYRRYLDIGPTISDRSRVWAYLSGYCDESPNSKQLGYALASTNRVMRSAAKGVPIDWALAAEK